MDWRAGLVLMAVLNLAPAAMTAAGPSELHRELVVEQDGRLSHEQRLQCTFSARGVAPRPVAVLRSIEAPSELISRDYFVYVSTRVLFSNRVFLALLLDPGMKLADAMGSVRCRPAGDGGAPLDFRVEMRMSAEGIRITTTDVAREHSVTDRLPWSDVLGTESGG